MYFLRMKAALCTSVVWWVSGACLIVWLSAAAAAPYPDLFQRSIIITNESPLTAYPVVQVPEDGSGVMVLSEYPQGYAASHICSEETRMQCQVGLIVVSFLFIGVSCSMGGGRDTGTATPNQVLDRYFAAVSSQSIDAVLAVFDRDAVIVTAAGEHRGHEAIAAFYRNGMFQCKQFQPEPGPRYVWKNQIAVEIGLDCDGKIMRVGDFFTVQSGKLTRMVVYSGPGYTPVKPAGK